MTITQTVEISADRRVLFEFLAPQEIPAGKVNIEVILTPVADKNTDQRSQSHEGATPHTDALLGILSNIGGDIAPDEIRTERMTKHLGLPPR